MVSVLYSPCQTWRENADKLAEWAWAQVNRVDCWGGYWTAADSTINRTTRPAKDRRGQVLLTKDILRRHFQAIRADDVLGLHTTSNDNTCRWGTLDIDAHGPGGNDPEVTGRVAVALYRELAEIGFNPLLTSSNGQGGYHLRLLFLEPIPSPRLFHFLQAVATRAVELGLSHLPETFPKQATIEPGKYGNWLRLPGRHHSREYWSEVYLWGRWWSGETAIQALLELEPSPADLVPAEPPPHPQPAPARIGPISGGGPVENRIRAYLAALPSGMVEGSGRDDVAYNLAAFLAHDCRVDDEVALAAMAAWDGCQAVPKGPDRLRIVLINARTYGRGGRR